MTFKIPDGHIVVWRVEHAKTGEGPCITPYGTDIIMRHPRTGGAWVEPCDDPVLAQDWKRSGGSGSVWHFGVAKLYEVYEWFHRWACNELHEAGFQLVAYTMPLSEARVGSTQVMFDKFGDDVEKAAVYSLHNFIANPELEEHFM